MPLSKKQKQKTNAHTQFFFSLNEKVTDVCTAEFGVGGGKRENRGHLNKIRLSEYSIDLSFFTLRKYHIFSLKSILLIVDIHQFHFYLED